MADRDRLVVLTDAQWAALEPLIEACRPRGKTPHHDLRRTIEAIIWRHENGAKWRSIPPELGPWWMAAQTFNRWGHLAASGSACSRQPRKAGSRWAWHSWMAPTSARTRKRRVRPEKGDAGRAGCPRGARPLARRL